MIFITNANHFQFKVLPEKFLRIFQAVIVIVNVAKNKGITFAFEGETVFNIYIGFEDSGCTLYRVTA